MADTLGLHISPDGITAVRVDAIAGTALSVIQLGTDGPAAVCAVAHDDGGAVVIGEAAADAPGLTVTDPLEQAGDGSTAALTAVINHVLGRAAAATGNPPRRLAIVVPDDWTAPQRDRVIEAAAAAGITNAVTVPLTAARSQSADTEPVVAIAAGAARVASLAAAPIVTREDLGQAPTPRAPVVLPPLDPPTGSVSVFDPDFVDADFTEPVRPAAEPVEAATGAPRTQVVPAVTAEPEPLRYEPPQRRLPGPLVAAVVLIGLIGAVGIALVAFGDDPSSTDTDQSTTLDPTSTTTEPTGSTTTLDPNATTSAPGQNTSTSSTTSTTTTEAPSTTPAPVAVGEPGVVTLSESGLRLEGGDLVLFDQSEESVLAALTEALGDPDSDTGFEESSFCFGARSRFVTWGHLEVVFTEEELDSGEARFTQWFADGHDDPEGLVTIGGVGVTATVAYLKATLGESLQLVAAIPGDPAGLFASTNPGSGGILNGTTTNRNPDGVVTSLWAGESCTRVFT